MIAKINCWFAYEAAYHLGGWMIRWANSGVNLNKFFNWLFWKYFFGPCKWGFLWHSKAKHWNRKVNP